ncbi:MAG: hypothetical protein H6747_08000 [Deltaproteobacteria bacterium]|nr:hypothetical protein [Deltaproteobacteria bacterium]
MQPLGLPLRSPDYPASATLPFPKGLTDEQASIWLAKRRLSIEPSTVASALTAGLPELLSLLQQLTGGGPGSEPMAERMLEAFAASDPSGTSTMPMPDYGPASILDLVLLGVAYPWVARLLGLGIVDGMAVAGKTYDYLIVADHPVRFEADVAAVVDWANHGMAPLSGVDWRVIEAVQPSNAAMGLPAPHRLWAFALPVPRTPLPDAPNKVSDRFAAVGVAIEALEPEGIFGDPSPRPVLYRLARADLGAPSAAQIASPKTATLLPWSQAKWTPLQTGDVWHLANGWIRSVGDEGETATHQSDWPPLHMDFIDAEVGERWYAYRARAMDWFGRVSRASAPAQWRRWPWPLKSPPPWYFHDVPELLGVVRSDAVLLLDRTPPPPPSAFTVTPIDPKDPLLVHGTQGKLAGFGARLGWTWTLAQQRQAPAATAFRVYFRKGLANTVPLTLLGATDLAKGEIAVLCKPVAGLSGAPAVLVGSSLRLANSGGKVVAGSVKEGSWELRVSVPSVKTAKDVLQHGLCSLAIAQQSPLWSEPGDVRDGTWTRRAIVPLSSGAVRFEAFRDAETGEPIAGSAVEVVAGGYRLNDCAVLAAVMPGLWQLRLEPPEELPKGLVAVAQTVDIASVDVEQRVVAVDGPVLASAKSWCWVLGQTVRRYEVELPLEAEVPEPAEGEGRAWFQLAVTTADDRPLTPDWLGSGPLAGVVGNEGLAAGPLPGWRVRRTPPKPPEPVWGEGPLYASPPDVDGKSYFTVRWKAGPFAVRIYRAEASEIYRRHWIAGGAGLDGYQVMMEVEEGGKKVSKTMSALAAIALVAPGATPGVAPLEDVDWGDAAARAEAEAVLVKAFGVGRSFGTVGAVYERLNAAAQADVAGAAATRSAYLPSSSIMLVSEMYPDVVGPDMPPECSPSPNTHACIVAWQASASARGFFQLVAVDSTGLQGSCITSPLVVTPRRARPASPVVVSVQADVGLDVGTMKPEELLQAIVGKGQNITHVEWLQPDSSGVTWIVEAVRDNEVSPQVAVTAVTPVPQATLKLPEPGRWDISIRPIGSDGVVGLAAHTEIVVPVVTMPKPCTWSLSPGPSESIMLTLDPHSSTVFVQGQFGADVEQLLGPILADSKAAEFPLPSNLDAIRIVAAESDGSRWTSQWAKP